MVHFASGDSALKQRKQIDSVYHPTERLENHVASNRPRSFLEVDPQTLCRGRPTEMEGVGDVGSAGKCRLAVGADRKRVRSLERARHTLSGEDKERITPKI